VNSLDNRVRQALPAKGESSAGSRRVIVCAGTGCVASGSTNVYEALCEEVSKTGIPVTLEFRPEKVPDGVLLTKSGCQGFCQMGPLVTILPDEIFYTRVKPEDVSEIVSRTLQGDEVVDRLLYVDPVTLERCKSTEDIAFYQRQTRYVLKECGLIDPENIHEYVAHGGYASALKAYTKLEPRAICDEISKAGLRGRGGAGFPTGRKWEAARTQNGTKKYIICNGDEGDPGAFMDRSVMEGNPHSVIEGLMIAARAVGADQTYIYVRAEYPLAVKRMRKAAEDAEKMGILGTDAFGSGQAIHCEVLEGAGAFVCGEETAMIASIEGRRGMPSPKPPFPAQKGLWERPTVINNVETLAQVPRILKEGGEVYKSIGTAASPGTKTFALTGHVVNTGLIEVPFGTTLREIVMKIGCGVTDDLGQIDPRGFKSVQIGGPSGGCLTQDHLDMPLDYDSLRGVGAIVGSGGLVVMNQNTCMVSVARFFMQFTQRESCGKCVLCREGTMQLLALLTDVVEGRATKETLDLMEHLAKAVQKGSLCGLGKTAPNPVLSTLRLFRDEYEAHVFDKRCPSGRCVGLMRPVIDPAVCKACGLCKRACPANAITGEKKKVHHINRELCANCGACIAICKCDAIERK